ncbi:hypothetical protein [Mucilaginibacter sp. UR6-11]|uniref:hypothetical protein n=1 Tax=Mucilaginibacter sp. UR6-11 TaxID=1435644 RepID=UPI001E3C5E2D|nr:hypothetical protein [Mucilaginibacter sp. UR6-11]MCC8427309.1 hypothetical protein [Mucilaginibacter sp. UR6-11]
MMKELCDFIPEFIYSVFTHQLSAPAIDFWQSKILVQPDCAPNKSPNNLVHKTLNITIGTVHSVKGETHLEKIQHASIQKSTYITL